MPKHYSVPNILIATFFIKKVAKENKSVAQVSKSEKNRRGKNKDPFKMYLK